MVGMYGAAVIAECILWAATAVGVYVDMVSAVFHWRWVRDGLGPSGVPVVALFFYEVRAFVRPLDWVNHVHRPWWMIGLAATMGLLFHLVLQHGVSRYARHVRSVNRRKGV
jgi:hypothetical protein